MTDSALSLLRTKISDELLGRSNEQAGPGGPRAARRDAADFDPGHPGALLDARLAALQEFAGPGIAAPLQVLADDLNDRHRSLRVQATRLGIELETVTARAHRYRKLLNETTDVLAEAACTQINLEGARARGRELATERRRLEVLVEELGKQLTPGQRSAARRRADRRNKTA